jgi:hypothetical protein
MHASSHSSWLFPGYLLVALQGQSQSASTKSLHPLFFFDIPYHRSIAIATPIQSRHVLPIDIAPRNPRSSSPRKVVQTEAHRIASHCMVCPPRRRGMVLELEHPIADLNPSSFDIRHSTASSRVAPQNGHYCCVPTPSYPNAYHSNVHVCTYPVVETHYSGRGNARLSRENPSSQRPQPVPYQMV